MNPVHYVITGPLKLQIPPRKVLHRPFYIVLDTLHTPALCFLKKQSKSARKKCQHSWILPCICSVAPHYRQTRHASCQCLVQCSSDLNSCLVIWYFSDSDNCYLRCSQLYRVAWNTSTDCSSKCVAEERVICLASSLIWRTCTVHTDKKFLHCVQGNYQEAEKTHSN